MLRMPGIALQRASTFVDGAERKAAGTGLINRGCRG